MTEEVGHKFDVNKPRADLLPFIAVGCVIDVLTYGKMKYGAHNWKKVKGWRWRYLGASFRHLFAYAMGEKHDPESNLPHLAHAGCSILFLLEMDKTNALDGDADE